MNLNENVVKAYLTKKGIEYREHGNELIAHCCFNDCDTDSKGREAHLYIEKNEGLYDCKKCGSKGNFVTLQKHFGDYKIKSKVSPRKTDFDQELVEQCHEALPQRIREYLNGRGIKDEVIDEYKLGYGTFYRSKWITIPVRDNEGEYAYFKLRQDPEQGSDKRLYPKGEAQLFNRSQLLSEAQTIYLTEGELDTLTLLALGEVAVSGTAGAATFKESWVEEIPKTKELVICYDRDEAGENGANRVAEMLFKAGHQKVSIATLPEVVGEHGDVTDFLTKHGGSIEQIKELAKPYPERIDTSQFSPMSQAELLDVLDLTIKHDVQNKLATFLCELSAYTDSAQFNISYNAPSSTGKSFIPTEIARLFPKEDVIEIAYCSPTAFFHDTGEYDKEKNQHVVDLSRKILIFLDQPHNDLLTRLRPLLSHDQKEIILKITDKNQKSGLRTKTILLRGYPSVIFCTAGLNIDEQEATRFLLLSPEVKQEKIRQGIESAIRREADRDEYLQWLESHPGRKSLKLRLEAIKQEQVGDIKIANYKKLEKRFLSNHKLLKPRHQRDIKRLVSIVKAFAVLNVWWRDSDGEGIVATDEDVESAFTLWDIISESQELNLPPYVHDLYKDVILPAWKKKNHNRSNFEAVTGLLGLSRQEVLGKHYEVYGRMMSSFMLGKQILPMLETAGLIIQEQDPGDKRKLLVFPTEMMGKKNSSNEGGVDEDDF